MSGVEPQEQVRVFQLIKGLGRGGAEMLLSEGLRHADLERFAYGYGYLLPWKDQLAGDLRDQGASVKCFRHGHPVLLPLTVLRVAGFLRSWQADVLHCHLPLTGVVGRLAAKLARVPVVYTEHNVMERYHPITRRANRWTWSAQAAAIAVSSDVVSSIHRNVNGAVPVRLVLNGIRVESFLRDEEAGRQVRRELGIPLDAPVVGTVAVFRRQKRLGTWLRVAREVLADQPDLHCLLVGDGPEREPLEELVGELGIGARVHRVGLQRDVQRFFSAMDVFMMASEFEGLPLALLEAMAADLPVVATAVGGIPEVVVAGETGFLVPPDEPERLAPPLHRLCEEPALRRSMGEAGRRRVSERFSMVRMARQLESLYLEVLGRPVHG